MGACTSILGIDRNYVESSGLGSTGGKGTGGMSTSGGSSAATGGVQTGGTGNGGGSVDAQACPSGEKSCPIGATEACVSPDPSVGCGPTGCQACTWPTNGYGVCTRLDLSGFR